MCVQGLGFQATLLLPWCCYACKQHDSTGEAEPRPRTGRVCGLALKLLSIIYWVRPVVSGHVLVWPRRRRVCTSVKRAVMRNAVDVNQRCALGKRGCVQLQYAAQPLTAMAWMVRLHQK